MRFLNASDFRSDVRFLRSTWTSCLPNGTEDAPALPRAGAFSFQTLACSGNLSDAVARSGSDSSRHSLVARVSEGLLLPN